MSGRVRRVLGDGHEDGHVLGARGHAARPHRGGLGATSIAAAADHGRRVHDGLLLLRRHLLELRLRLQLAHDEAGLLLVLLLELMRLLRWELLLLHGKATDGHLLLLLRVWGKERYTRRWCGKPVSLVPTHTCNAIIRINNNKGGGRMIENRDYLLAPPPT